MRFAHRLLFVVVVFFWGGGGGGGGSGGLPRKILHFKCSEVANFAC